MYWVLQLVAVDILVLTIWTVVDGPRKEDRNEVIGGTRKCGLRNSSILCSVSTVVLR